jgi:hypothetical protein
LGLPLGWRDLEQWVLEQLPENGPNVVLVGMLTSEAGELARRLQQSRPQWLAVRSPLELPPQPNGMQLPALPGWDQEDLRILASSRGLHDDGWLETPCRLVIQMLRRGSQADSLQLGLYLPEQELQLDHPTVSIQINDEKPCRQVLQPGLNPVALQCPKRSSGTSLVLQMSSAHRVQPTNPSDQRRLMAVLVNLERCPASVTPMDEDIH